MLRFSFNYTTSGATNANYDKNCTSSESTHILWWNFPKLFTRFVCINLTNCV